MSIFLVGRGKALEDSFGTAAIQPGDDVENVHK